METYEFNEAGVRISAKIQLGHLEIKLVNVDGLTDDAIALAKAYWTLDDEGEWVYEAEALAKTISVNSVRVITYLSKNLGMLVTYCEPDSVCEVCGEGLTIDSRRDYRRAVRGKKPGWHLNQYGVCGKCRLNQPKVAPEQKPAMDNTAEAKGARIREGWSNPPSPVEFSSLSLSQAATLFLLTLAYATRNGEHFDYQDAGMRFTPSEDLDIELLRELFWAKGLTVDLAASELSDFTDDGKSVYLFQAKLRPNVTVNGKLLKIKELKQYLLAYFERRRWEPHWNEQLKPLWVRLAVEECVQFTQDRAENYNLGMPPLERHRSQLELLLEKFSVSECFYFIAAAYLTASGFLGSQQCKGRPHALNTIPGRIEKLAMQPRQQIKKFDRTNAVPRSLLSEVLFDRMLGSSNDTGFRLSPGEYAGSLLVDRIDYEAEDEAEAGAISTMAPLDWNTDAIETGDWYGMLPDGESLLEWASQAGNQDVEVLAAYALNLQALVEKLRPQLPPGAIEKLVEELGVG